MADIALQAIRDTWKDIARDYGPLKQKFVRLEGDTTTDTAALVKLVASSFAFGIVLHQLAKRIEIDRYPLSILGTLLGVFIAQSIGLQEFSNQFAPQWKAWQLALLVQVVALTSLFANIIIYRVFLHPLNGFPGPTGAKLTKFVKGLMPTGKVNKNE